MDEVRTSSGPTIGIPTPTWADEQYNLRSWPQYAEAIRGAGGIPRRIPLQDTSAAREAAEECDGFVLPGSPADVAPEGYGRSREVATAIADVPRERCDRMLLEEAAGGGKPILGICFGLQMLNVFAGGVLVQDLQPAPVNHAAGSQVAVAHSVSVDRRSLLAGLLTIAEAPDAGQLRVLPVNSSHHQAVAIPGEGLSVVARSTEDAVIEALEGFIGGAPVLGVQWHPERSYELSPASRALFAWMVSAAADRALGPVGIQVGL